MNKWLCFDLAESVESLLVYHWFVVNRCISHAHIRNNMGISELFSIGRSFPILSISPFHCSFEESSDFFSSERTNMPTETSSQSETNGKRKPKNKVPKRLRHRRREQNTNEDEETKQNQPSEGNIRAALGRWWTIRSFRTFNTAKGEELPGDDPFLHQCSADDQRTATDADMQRSDIGEDADERFFDYFPSSRSTSGDRAHRKASISFSSNLLIVGNGSWNDSKANRDQTQCNSLRWSNL